MQNKKIVGKIALIIIFNSILMIFALITITYFYQKKSITRTYTNQLSNRNITINTKLTKIITSEIKIASYFSKHHLVISSLKKNKYEALSRTFKLFSNELDRYENIFLSTSDNVPKIVAAANYKTIGQRWAKVFSENIYYAQKGAYFISQTSKSYDTGRYRIIVTVPVLLDFKTIGIIGVSVDFENNFQSLVEEVKIGKTGQSYILDRDGIVIAHSIKTELKKDYSIYNWHYSNLMQAEDGVFTQRLNSKKMISSFLINKKLGTIFVSSITIDEVNKLIFDALNVMVIIGIVIFLLSCGLTLYFTEREVKRNLQ